MAESRAARNAAKSTTKTAPAKAPAKKATAPTKAAPAKKSAAPAKPKAETPTPVTPTVTPAKATTPKPAEKVDNAEDSLLGGMATQAKALREKGLTVAEVATELKVSAAVARELCEGTPRAQPKKERGTGTGRVASHPSVTVENGDTPVTCTGACKETKPARQFPTLTGPTVRSSECRKCRDARREAKIEAAATATA